MDNKFLLNDEKRVKNSDISDFFTIFALILPKPSPADLPNS